MFRNEMQGKLVTGKTLAAIAMAGLTLGVAPAAASASTDLSIANASVTEGNSGTTPMTFTITRSGTTTGPSSVYWSTADGTATAGSDYVAQPLTRVDFVAGQTSQKVSVTVIGDTVLEGNESLFVNLSSPTGATISDGRGVGTIFNDEPVTLPSLLSISDVSKAEGNSGITTFTFTISRSGGTTATSTVAWSTVNGSASAGSDYVAVQPTKVTFNPGDTTKTVSVSVLGDRNREATENFLVKLSAPTGAGFKDDTGVGYIVNDD